MYMCVAAIQWADCNLKLCRSIHDLVSFLKSSELALELQWSVALHSATINAYGHDDRLEYACLTFKATSNTAGLHGQRHPSAMLRLLGVVFLAGIASFHEVPLALMKRLSIAKETMAAAAVTAIPEMSVVRS